MISDDRRREVAENLRHPDDETCALIDERMHRLTNEMLTGHAVLNISLCMVMCEAGFDTKTFGDFWDLLADLIDPTCEYVPIGEGRFGCSGCGYTVKLDFDVPVTDETPMPFKHCPECGARVVRDGD